MSYFLESYKDAINSKIKINDDFIFISKLTPLGLTQTRVKSII